MDLNRLRDPEAWKPYVKNHNEWYCERAAVNWIRCLDSEPTKLNLSMNGLIKLPPEIWSLENLEKLDIGENEIEEIPADIIQLTKLKWLRCSNNKLKDLPRELLGLENLEAVYRLGNCFEDEGLQTIESSCNSLPYLKERASRRIKFAGKR
jgi:Leucine-rich repeat (LRR) protein